MEPIHLIPIVAIIMGTLTILVPVSLIALRFAIKPIAEAVAQMRSGVSPNEVAIMKDRISLLEQQVSGMDSEMGRIAEAMEFQDRLLSAAEEEG